MHEFKGAIFDMDGTLLDSMPVWKRLTAGYLEQFGVHITDQEYAATEGMSQPEVATDVAKCVALSNEKAEIAVELEQLYEKWEELAE